jgi:hypothetical protein
MNDVALTLYYELCDVGNALELLRDTYSPASEQWLWHTELLGMLDAAIDRLVRSSGLDEESDDA